MTRTIKASEIKRGMKIRVEYLEVTHELTVSYVASEMGTGSVEARTRLGGSVYLPECRPVTVVSEPQPEEPTWFGARVVVDGRKFLRSPASKFDVLPWLEEGESVWRDWDDLINMGSVQVIPDPGWTVPSGSEADEVPTRIQSRDDWPEDDTPMRSYKWEAHGATAIRGDIWEYVDGAWTWYRVGGPTKTVIRWPAPATNDFPLTRTD